MRHRFKTPVFLALIGLAMAACADTPTKAPLADERDGRFNSATSRSVGVNRVSEKPDYVHPLGEEAGPSGRASLKDWNWLEVGIESRTRYEDRSRDYTTLKLTTDDALVTRNLVYLGIRHALDPLRFAVEFEDSRRFLSDRASNGNIEDHAELLQGYAQLHFDHAFGNAPLSLSLGRMSFDSIDRRLVERTRNRNALAAYDGLRLRLGDANAPWEVDAFAMRPVDRNVDALDHSSAKSTLYGVTAYLRQISPHLVLEPYWLWLDQRREIDPSLRKNLHTFGFHAFGQWGRRSAWDYDVDLAGQLGSVGKLDHRAGAAHLETGYTWDAEWKPRLGLWFNYASGDRNPKDGTDERFDPLFGDTFSFYGYSGYFSWQNMISPALHLSIRPAKGVKCEVIHRAVWLASDTDSWVRANRRDSTGRSGSYVGQETDARVIWQVCERFELDLAYAHFFPGSFTNRTGPAPGSDFVQIAATLKF
ncbi:MAG: alginate export family protein [Chthoniobacteraceae bacterium]